MTEGKSNNFSYRGIYSMGEWTYKWEASWEGVTVSGSSDTVRQAYRLAKKEIRRFRRMKKFLNKKV